MYSPTAVPLQEYLVFQAAFSNMAFHTNNINFPYSLTLGIKIM